MLGFRQRLVAAPAYLRGRENTTDALARRLLEHSAAAGFVTAQLLLAQQLETALSLASWRDDVRGRRVRRYGVEPLPARDRLVAEQLQALAYLHPLGRLGSASEVAELIVQVLDAEWMTGSVVSMDGGLSL